MAMKIRKSRPEKIVNKTIVPKAAALVFFILCTIIAFFYTSKTWDSRGLMTQAPADKIKLPAGIKMNIPAGYTVFKTKMYGMTVYSFVKYTGTWKWNALFKADLTVMPVKVLAPEALKISSSAPEFNGLVAGKKIFLQEKREQELEKDNQGEASYETDYRAFQPLSVYTAAIKGRQWNVYSLGKKEGTDRQVSLKTWNNFYTVYKDCVLVIDYIVIGDVINGNKGSVPDNAGELKEIEEDIKVLIEGILFS
jgi:hypothetical protein